MTPGEKSEHNRKYREANREKLRLKATEYYREKRAKLLEDNKFRYNANRKEICKKLRESYATNGDYTRAYNKEQRLITASNMTSQVVLAGRYIPIPRRTMNLTVNAPIKTQTVLPSGARYTVVSPASAWGTEDLFGQQLRQKDRRR
jgi:hypothetical protein